MASLQMFASLLRHTRGVRSWEAVLLLPAHVCGTGNPACAASAALAGLPTAPGTRPRSRLGSCCVLGFSQGCAASARCVRGALEQGRAQWLTKTGSDSPLPPPQMRSKRDFVHEERIAKGGRERVANVVEGLELHRGVLNAAEQAMMVSHIESWMQAGRLVSGCFLPLAAFYVMYCQTPIGRVQCKY